MRELNDHLFPGRRLAKCEDEMVVGFCFDDLMEVIQVWSVCNPGGKTHDAAKAFNVSISLVERAIDEHPWMEYYDDGSIDHEGL